MTPGLALEISDHAAALPFNVAGALLALSYLADNLELATPEELEGLSAGMLDAINAVHRERWARLRVGVQ
jgi:hypothetical protein